MTGWRILGSLVTAWAMAIAGVVVASDAHAVGQLWNGRYSFVSYAAEKSGTSLAARQNELDFSDEFSVVTNCSTGRCIATVSGGPAPKNPTLPHPPRYTWDGAKWLRIYDWKWDCFQGPGAPKVWTPARSVAYYIPQTDGSLRGVWRTDIGGGPCGGSVEMAVSAFPVM
jgi:hypothetical protein